MSWQSEWKALSNRIQGLADAATYLAHAGVGDYSANDDAPRIASDIAECLISFWDRYQKQAPQSIVAPIFFFQGAFHSRLRGQPAKTVAALMLVKSEVDYAIADVQAVIRSLTERAFEHLQRSIIADDDFRSKWNKAFSRRRGGGETACERLGAVHLLSHGIWAFKAHAPGERTDLVLGETINDMGQIERVAEGLVLTEWKLIRDKSEIRRKARQARSQAEKYGSGSLAGFELHSKRYIVLVSKDIDIGNLSDEKHGDVTYHHIGIRVAPSTPSKIVRRLRT